MAFEDLQRAFIEADLEKAKLKPKKTKVAKALTKPKKGIGKKIALTKVAKKAKDKVKAKTPKEIAEAKKKALLAREKERNEPEFSLADKTKGRDKNQRKVVEPEPSLSDKAEIAAEVAALRWAEIPDSTSIAQPEANVPSILDQKEAINKTIPNPQDFAAERTAALVASMKAHSGAHADASVAASKSPITQEVKAAKAAAAKDAGPSMNAILASHSNK